MLDILGDATAIDPRQVVQPQPLLQPTRAMQDDVTKSRTQPLYAVFEFWPFRGTDGQRYRGVQHWRASARLQDLLVLAGQRAVVVCLPRRSVRGFELIAIGLLGIHDALAHLAQRLAVAQPPHMHDCIDREGQSVQWRPQQLGARAGKDRRLGESTEAEHRLEALVLVSLQVQARRLRRVFAQHNGW